MKKNIIIRALLAIALLFGINAEASAKLCKLTSLNFDSAKKYYLMNKTTGTYIALQTDYTESNVINATPLVDEASATGFTITGSDGSYTIADGANYVCVSTSTTDTYANYNTAVSTEAFTWTIAYTDAGFTIQSEKGYLMYDSQNNEYAYTDGEEGEAIYWDICVEGEKSVTVIEGASLTIPEYMDDEVTVYLYMANRTKDYKTTICLPFKMKNSQVCTAFGNDAKLYYYNSSTATTLSFIPCNLISAGIPYLLIPSDDTETADETAYRTAAAENNSDLADMRLYIIEGVKSSSFTTEAYSITYDNWTFVPVFEDTTLPTSSCSYQSDGVFRRIKTSDSTLPAYQAYFVSPTGCAKALPNAVFGDDEWATNINDIETSNESLTIYNVNGQLVRQNTTEGLAKGVYIVNGKKIMVR